MRAVDLIARKRDGEEMSTEEIRFLVDGFVRGDVPDYQMSAFLMAVCCRGMTQRETADLTRAMIESGERVTLTRIHRFKADKHSTGGVGDKTTLVLAPLLASFGLAVPKLSGRGLGHTGGTLDKLESIPGFRTDLSIRELEEVADEVGVAVAASSESVDPADHEMYALRDVTATVDSLPLIVASIMSKKLAIENDALVLDVKVGDGAFFCSERDAHEFAKTALAIGSEFGRPTSAVLTAMEQPLGCAVGNALEVREAIAALQGHGPEDLAEVCVALATQLLSARDHRAPDELRDEVRERLASGGAWPCFVRWIERQGGDVRAVEDPSRLPAAGRRIEVRAPRSGVICGVRARAIGHLAQVLGAGRARKEDEIDLGAGVELRAKVGSEVREGDVLAVLHTNLRSDPYDWESAVLGALSWREEPLTPGPTVLGTVTQ